MSTRAMLLINMPEDCVHCPCYRQDKEHGVLHDGQYVLFEDCKAMQKPLTIEERDGRPSWCPLKPMPEQMTWGHTSDYIVGYNACLEEITGETE